METRSVSRCIAIAAHGKRCQQSPFRGSPYCWHHTQSRKVWPPSRPTPVPPRDERRATTAERDERERLRTQAHLVAARLAAELDADTTAVLVDFLDSTETGALVLAREGGRLVVVEGPRPARQRPRVVG